MAGNNVFQMILQALQGAGMGALGDPMGAVKMQQQKQMLQMKLDEAQENKEKNAIMAQYHKALIQRMEFEDKSKQREIEKGEKPASWLEQPMKDVQERTEGPSNQVTESPLIKESTFGPDGVNIGSEPSRMIMGPPETREIPPPMGTKTVPKGGPPKINWGKVPLKDMEKAIKYSKETTSDEKPLLEIEKYAKAFGLDFKGMTGEQFVTLKAVKDKWEAKEDKEDISLFHTKDDDGNVTAHLVNKKTKVGESIPLGQYGTTKTPPAQVNVTTNVGSKSMTEIGTQMGKQLVEQRKDVLQARTSLMELAEAEKLINSPIITGAGANYILSFGKGLQQIGFNVATDETVNTEAFIALMGKQVGQIIKQFGSGTGLSDADREYAEKISGGKITLNKDSIKKIIAINKKGLRNVISNFNKTAKEVMSKPGANDLPYDLSVGMEDLDKKENLREKYGY